MTAHEQTFSPPAAGYVLYAAMPGRGHGHRRLAAQLHVRERDLGRYLVACWDPRRHEHVVLDASDQPGHWAPCAGAWLHERVHVFATVTAARRACRALRHTTARRHWRVYALTRHGTALWCAPAPLPGRDETAREKRG